VLLRRYKNLWILVPSFFVGEAPWTFCGVKVTELCMESPKMNANADTLDVLWAKNGQGV